MEGKTEAVDISKVVVIGWNAETFIPIKLPLENARGNQQSI